jgi:hypothetical protein
MTAGYLRDRLADVPANTEIVVDLGSLDEFYELRVRALLPAVSVLTLGDGGKTVRLAPALVLEAGQEITEEKHLISRTDDYLDGPRT